MTEVLELPRWQAVGLVIDQNNRDFLSGRYGLAHDLMAWFKAITLFRSAEDQRMILREPTPEDLRHHRTWLATLIAEGERLLSEAHWRGGLPEGAVRFSLGDVEATIETLRVDERMWHATTVSRERRREILKAVFNVEESRT